MQAEYLAEGIEWTQIEWRDNAEVVELIDGRPHGRPGILAALSDTWRLGEAAADAHLLAELHQSFGGGGGGGSLLGGGGGGVPVARSQSFARPRSAPPGTVENARASGHARYVRPRIGADAHFCIVHYAGEVRYGVEGWAAKNRESVSDDVRRMLEGSGVAALLGAAVNPTTALEGARGPLSPTTVKRGFGKPIGGGAASGGAPGRRASKIRDATVAERFSEQLRRLMKRVGDGSTLYGTRLGHGSSHAQPHTTHPAPLPPLQVRALHRGQPHARAVGL